MKRMNAEDKRALRNDFRRILIRDAMTGVAHTLAHEGVYHFAFFDALMLLYQRPIVISAWNLKNELVFSTLGDQFFKRSLGPTLQPDAVCTLHRVRGMRFRLSFHKYSGSRLVPDPAACHVAAQLFEKAMGSTNLDQEVLEVLGKSLNHYEGKVFEDVPLDSGIRVEYHVVLSHLEGMRQVLEDAFQEAGRSPFMRSGNIDLPNIFTAIRTVHGDARRYQDSFEFTAGLLLTPSQKEAVQRWCEQCSRRGSDKCDFRQDPMKCVAALETPLGPRSRSIADAVFCSGVVDFGRKVSEEGWDIAGDEPDRQRQEIEKLVFGALNTERRGKPTVFYVPIHVGGTPWAAAFTFTEALPEKHDRSWRHNYNLYRDVIPKAAAHIRTEAKQVFLKIIEKKFLEHLRSSRASGAAFASAISQKWGLAAQVYPFDYPEMILAERGESKSEGGIRIDVPRIGRFNLAIKENRFFRRQVQYGLLDSKEVLEACNRTLDNYLKISAKIELRALGYTAHMFKNPLEQIQWVASKISDPELKSQIHELVHSVLDLELFANALNSEEKRKAYLERAPKMAAVNLAALLERRVDDVLLLYSRPSFSAHSARKVESLNSANKLRRDFSALATLGTHMGLS